MLNFDGHRWELNTCINCGMVRKTRAKAYLYSRDGFKTYETRAGICYIKPKQDENKNGN